MAIHRRLDRLKLSEVNLQPAWPRSNTAAALAKKGMKGECGMEGMKLGKHRVPESQVVIQFGEDLSESLRGLKISLW